MKKVAILVDGDFYLRRYRSHFGSKSSSDPVKVAHEMWLHCMRHINKEREQL